MVRRSKMEVIADILTEALNGACKTRIMYLANLNFLRVNRYFSELLEMGLIVKENHPNGGAVYYRTTEKGKDLLQILKKAQQFVSNYNEKRCVNDIRKIDETTE